MWIVLAMLSTVVDPVEALPTAIIHCGGQYQSVSQIGGWNRLPGCLSNQEAIILPLFSWNERWGHQTLRAATRFSIIQFFVVYFFFKQTFNMDGREGDVESNDLNTSTSSDRFIDSLLRVAYEVSLNLPKSKLVFPIIFVLEFLQVASYLWHEESSIPWSTDISSLSSLGTVLRFDFVRGNTSAHLFYLLVAVLLLSGNIITAVWLNSLMKNGTASNHLQRQPSVRFLRAMVLLFPTVLFIPVLNILLSTMNCSSTMVIDVFGCGTPLHMSMAFVVVLLSTLAVIQAFMFETLGFECRPSCNEFLARSNSRYNTKKLAEKLLLVIAFAVLFESNSSNAIGWNYSVVLLATTHFNAISLTRFLPFYNFRLLLAYCGLAWVRAWFAQSIALFLLFDSKSSQIGATIMSFWAAPLSILCAMGLTYRRRATLSFKAVSQLTSPDEVELKVRFAMLDMKDHIKVLRTQAASSAAADEVVKAEEKSTLNTVKRYFIEGLNAFPDSLPMKSTAIIFFSAVLSETNQAQSLLMRTRANTAHSSSLEAKYQIYRARRFLELAERSAGSDDVMWNIKLSAKCREAEKLTTQALVKQFSFWTLLLADHVDVEALQNAGTAVVKTIL